MLPDGEARVCPAFSHLLCSNPRSRCLGILHGFPAYTPIMCPPDILRLGIQIRSPLLVRSGLQYRQRETTHMMIITTEAAGYTVQYSMFKETMLGTNETEKGRGEKKKMT